MQSSSKQLLTLFNPSGLLQGWGGWQGQVGSEPIAGRKGLSCSLLFQMWRPLAVRCPTAQCHPLDMSSGICRWVAGHMHYVHTQRTYGISSSAISFNRVVFALGREQWCTMRYLLCRWAKLCPGWQTICRYRQTLCFFLDCRLWPLMLCVWGATRAVHAHDAGAADVSSTSDPATPPPNTLLAGWIMPMQHAKLVQR